MMNDKGWIGVDLDGTLAKRANGGGITQIGEPVPAMVARVKAWLAEGKDVRIVTARVCPTDEPSREQFLQITSAMQAICDWCKLHLGRELDVTCMKDFEMIELWDDRAVQVEPDTGRRMDGKE